jgi:protein SCO1/2
VTKIPARKVEVPAVADTAPSTSSAPRLREGDEMPEFSLTNQDGATITRETLRGKPFVLTFVFTRCPVPNFCPLMSKNFARLQEAIGAAGDDSLGQAQLLSISFDPEHDTPAVMKEFAASEHADPRIWNFASGAPAQINSLTSAFAVMLQPEGRTISHGLATALVDRNGRVVEIWRGNRWKPDEVIEKIKTL